MTVPVLDYVAPAHHWVPERVGSYGDEAIDLAEVCGRKLDPEQKLAVDAMLSYGPGGRWVALEEAIIEARQNGKTTNVLEPVVAFDLFMLPPDRIAWTAHLFKTARDAFDDFCMWIETTPELSKRVKNISYANGEEAIELHSGASLEFLARSKGGGRGLGAKRVVMDEALYVASLTMAALLPTLSARPNAQIMYGSSAGVDVSAHLRSLRNRGRRGGDPSLIYLEWCAPEGGCADGEECDHALDREGCALDDERNWQLGNHALDRRITREYVRSERRALEPADFARERCGWWDEPAEVTELVIPLDVWAGQLLRDMPDGAPLGFAVDMTPDRTWTSIAVAATGDVVDIVEHQPGSRWLVEACSKLWERHRVPFAVDPRGPAANEIDDLRDAGIEVVEPTTEQLTRACADFLDDIADVRVLKHTGRTELDTAVEGAKKRSVGDGFAWDRKKTAVISPLVAATLARWAATQSGGVQVFGADALDKCDACGIHPHEDPDGDHDYLCVECRPEEGT